MWLCVCMRVCLRVCLCVSSLSLQENQVLADLLSSVPASQCGKQLTVASGETHH